MEFDINTELETNQQIKLKKLLIRFSNCFAQYDMDLGFMNIGYEPLPILTENPVNLPRYRLELWEQNELQTQVNELLNPALIVP